MKTLLIPVLLLTLSLPALAAGGNNNDQGQNNNDQGQNKTRGAPGPVIGAGLPRLLIGGGIYWIVRRRKRRPNFVHLRPSTSRVRGAPFNVRHLITVAAFSSLDWLVCPLRSGPP